MKFDTNKTAKEIYAVIMRDASAYGGFPFYGAVFLGALLLRDYTFSYDLLASLLAITFVVAVVRLAHFKPRPGKKPEKYNTLYERVDNSSFPSIHVARAVMISMAFYVKMPVVLPLLALLTLCVILSRLHFKRHDWTDMVVGGLIGLVLGWVFFF